MALALSLCSEVPPNQFLFVFPACMASILLLVSDGWFGMQLLVRQLARLGASLVGNFAVLEEVAIPSCRAETLVRSGLHKECLPRRLAVVP